MSATRSIVTEKLSVGSGNNDAGEEIAERVLLPVDEMLFGFNRLRIAENGGPAMGRRPEPDDLRAHGQYDGRSGSAFRGSERHEGPWRHAHSFGRTGARKKRARPAVTPA